MQVKTSIETPPQLRLTIAADSKDLSPIKAIVLKEMAKSVKVAGFRAGKAPIALIEKQLDPNALQSQFLDESLNQLYSAALQQEKLRPVSQPKVDIKKFVPFSTVEFEATLEIIGDIRLGDYKKLSATMPKVTISAKDIDEVIEALRKQTAEKKDITRAAKKGDQVWIDFAGKDAKSSEPIKGAEGKEYPIILGTNTFIPGFEENVEGLKAGQEKEFTVTFPADYRVSALKSKKVTFTVKVTRVQEVLLPKVDDVFAVKAAPVKNVAELKEHIKTQLTSEKQYEAQRDYETALIKLLVDKSEAAIPDSLISEQIDRIIQDEKQNIVYRGQTWQEYLDVLGQTEEAYRESIKPVAIERVKAGLILGEVADAEKIEITPEEFEMRKQILKSQYKDEAMHKELDNPDQQRDIVSRMLSEKTIAKLVELNK